MMRTRRHAIRSMFALGSILILGSCGGSDSTGPGGGTYYLRFRANGTQVSFTLQTHLTGTFAQSGTQYNAIFVGFDGLVNANVQVYDGSAITTTTYSGYGIVGAALRGAIMGYHDAAGTLYVSGNGQTDAMVTVQEITSEYVRGIFSGRLMATGKADLDISNGEFKVPRVN
jgi:hypothetical protein